MNVKATVISSRFGYAIELSFYDPRTQVVHRTEQYPQPFRSREDANQMAEKLSLSFLNDSIMASNAPKKSPAKKRAARRQPTYNAGRWENGRMVWN